MWDAGGSGGGQLSGRTGLIGMSPASRAGVHKEATVRTLLASPPAVTLGDAQSCYYTFTPPFRCLRRSS
jgi:hypothetical protein